MMHLTNLLRCFFISVVCLSLCACGFNLRGHTALPPQLHTLYLQTEEPYNQFSIALKQALHSIGVKLLEDPHQAPMALQVLNTNYAQQLASVSSSSQIRQYLLTYTVTYQITKRDGKVIVPPQTVTTTRTYTLNANQILGDTSTQENLRGGMQRDVIYQIINRLGSHATLKALAKQN